MFLVDNSFVFLRLHPLSIGVECLCVKGNELSENELSLIVLYLPDCYNVTVSIS